MKTSILIPKVAEERFYYLTSSFFRYAFLVFVAGLFLAPFIGMLWYTHSIAQNELVSLEDRLKQEQVTERDLRAKAAPLLERRNFLQRISTNQRIPISPLLFGISKTIDNQMGIQAILLKTEADGDSRKMNVNMSLFWEGDDEPDIEKWINDLNGRILINNIEISNFESEVVDSESYNGKTIDLKMEVKLNKNE